MWKKLFLLTVIIWMISPTQSAVIECSWDPEMTNCSPYNITPVTQPNEIITINGKPSNYVNPNTTSIWFYNQVFDYIPVGLLTLFPNLQQLALDRGQMTSLSTDSIPNCGVLSHFMIRGGLVTHIPAGFLESCKSLTALEISDNNITTLDVDALRGLTNLGYLSFQHNKISCIPPSFFRHNPVLSSVDFQYNLITAIDNNLFANLPKMLLIGFRSNLLTSIPLLNLAFSSDTSSNNLLIDFISNPIFAINPDFCSVFGSRPDINWSIYFSNIPCLPALEINIHSSSICTNLTELQNCYANWTSSMNNPVTCGITPTTTTVPPTSAIVTTPSPTPGSCPSDKICRYFLDQYNRYTCILDGVDSVLTSISGNHLITFADVNVRRVVFTNSFLSRIPPILFQKFTNLEYLTVSNCSMSAINTNSFTACGNLKYFDASSNFITTVDGASFKSCVALEVIDLSGNQLDMISGQLFVNNPNLKAVYINRPQGMVLI